MGLLAELGRLSIGTWSPRGSGGGYIAAGTYAQDETSFNDTVALELLTVDIQRSKLVPVSTFKSSTKFSSIDWGNPSRSHPAGLIAGGLVDGTVRVWDAASLIRPPKSPDDNYGIVYSSSSLTSTSVSTSSSVGHDKHTAPVRAIQFNPHMQHLLASGGADGQLFVWDLSNPSAGVTPRHPAASKSGPPAQNPSSKEEVTALAWNRKFHNILSTATSAGVMNVWDLKQGRQVISIRNPRGRMRCSSVAWHPEIATQIVITCDEDDSTAAVLWDLRNATAPVNSYAHHAPKGIVSASWSSHDSDLLLTSSKDGRTAVVSMSTNEVVVDSPRSSDYNFDVKWSPRIPGLYFASSFDGRLSVNSILSASSAPSVSSETANALAESFGANANDFRSGMAEQSPRTTDSQRVFYSMSKPPKWLKRPSALCFAFGGWKAHFSAKDGVNVTVDSFTEEIPSMSAIPEKLDKVLMDLTSNDPSPAHEWCMRQRKAAETPKDKMGWDVLAILFSTDSRRKLIQYLGFSIPPKDAVDDIDMPVYGLLQSQPISIPVRSDNLTGAAPKDVTDGAPVIKEDETPTNGISGMNLDGPAPWDVSDTFGAGENTNESLLDGDDSEKPGNGGKESSNTKPTVEEKKNSTVLSLTGKTKSEIDEFIKNAVIVADFKAAVDACLHVGKVADALVISHAGGPDLWAYAQAEYMSMASASSASKVIGAIAGPKSKMDEFIKQAGESGKRESWKEALAAILTYIPAEDFYETCTSLGNRLVESKNDTGALACFLCASNVGMVASLWTEQHSTKGKSSSALMADRVEQLCASVERIRLLTSEIVLSQGEHEIGMVTALDEISGSILCEFGALLAVQGDYQAAITYLSNLDPSYSCVYGSAEDLNRKATDCLAMSDKNNVDSNYSGGGYIEPSNNNLNSNNNINNYNAPYGSFQGGYSNTSGIQQPSSTTSPGGYEQSPYMPPPPPLMHNSTMNPAPIAPPAFHSYPTAQPNATVTNTLPPPPVGNMNRIPPHPVSAGLPPVPPVSTTGPVRPGGGSVMPGKHGMRPSRDPSSVYADAPVAQVPPAPSVGNVGMTPPAPYAPNVGQGYGVPGAGTGGMHVPGTNGSYGPQSGIGAPPIDPSAQGMPPPPPTDGDTSIPRPYFPNAKHGAGAKLPHSAEIAVAEGRRERAPSSSGTPGGPPKRSTSMSSSISALVTETVYLDKLDMAKIGKNDTVIVKAFRNSLAQARGMNTSGMYRRKMDDINKRLGKLAAGLSAGLVDQEIVEQLMAMANTMDKSSFQEAQSILSVLSKQYWDVHRQWLQGLKWLLDCVTSGR